MNTKTNSSQLDNYIVGVGASAGGMNALIELLKAFESKKSNFSIVVVQHLSPSFKSELPSILQNQTEWPVHTVKNDTRPQSGNIYVTPQNKQIVVTDYTLKLKNLETNYHHAPSIDIFFKSLADEFKSFAIGIILSGTGDDGSKGIIAIKELGGFTLAQDPRTADYSDMPKSALLTDKIDIVVEPSGMYSEIVSYIDKQREFRNSDIEKNAIDNIFSLLAKKSGIDFSQYKPSTIMRRINKRVEALKKKSISEYNIYLSNSPKEVDNLFNTVLIGVTEFFRDEESFEQLTDEIKKLLENHESSEPLRVWCVGCATGEEPYSIAILFHELLGPKIHQSHLQIFATDIDQRALETARRGVYSEDVMKKLSPDFKEKYFNLTEDGYEVKKIVKQHILFSKHDITNDPPFVKTDLIVCRNLLIYFNNYLQKETLRIFNYALKPDGLLFLGKSESVSVASELFTKIESTKIFRKIHSSLPVSFRFSRFQNKQDSFDKIKPAERTNMSLVEIAKETLYFSNDDPFVIINENGDIKETQGSLRLYMELSQGTMNSNIFKMANNELRIELRSLMALAKKEHKTHESSIIKFELFDKDNYVKMKIKPLAYPTSGLQHFILIFQKITPNEHYLQFSKDLNSLEFEAFKIRELEQETVSLKEHLQTFTEELETSNEEMQAMNEELQSANEELKSTNEELETSNEELQSANEELQTANNELRHTNNLLIEKEAELTKAKNLSEKNELLYRTIAENIPNGTVGLLNDKLKIEYIAGKSLIDRNLKLEGLKGKSLPEMNPSEEERNKLTETFKKTLKGESLSIEYRYDDDCFSLDTIPLNIGDKRQIMFLSQKITEQKRSEQLLLQSEKKFRALADNIPILCWMADADGSIYWFNSQWYEFTGQQHSDAKGWGWQSAHDPEVLPQVLEKWKSSIEKAEPFEMVFPLKRHDGIYKKFMTRIVPIFNNEGKLANWFGTNTDITERESIADQKDEFIGVASHELKTPVATIKGFIQVIAMLLKKGEYQNLQSYLAKAESNVDKLTGIINELLDVSKISAGELVYNFSKFSVKEFIDDCIEQVSYQDDQHKIITSGNLDLYMYGDKIRLEQVVNNLLTNAIKYSPDSNEIYIHVEQKDSDIEISISDTGIGIAEEKQAFIFDRFFRIEKRSNKFQGLGIGLYICYEIIRRHNGTIKVFSRKGEGSTFSFQIPLSEY